MTKKDALNAGTKYHDQWHRGIQQEMPRETEGSPGFCSIIHTVASRVLEDKAQMD